MKPPPPASAFGGSVGKNARLKEESVVVTAAAVACCCWDCCERQIDGQVVVLGNSRLDECARLHAAAESIRRFAANAIHDSRESLEVQGCRGAGVQGCEVQGCRVRSAAPGQLTPSRARTVARSHPRTLCTSHLAPLHPCTLAPLHPEKNGGVRRRSASPPNDSPTGVEFGRAWNLCLPECNGK